MFKKDSGVRLTSVARNAYLKLKTDLGDELAKDDDMYCVSQSCYVHDESLKVAIYKFVNGFRKEYDVLYFELRPNK